MKDFSSIVPNNGLAFPYTKPIDCTTPQSFDGTPITASMIGEFWGFFQAAMHHAGIFPSGNQETIDASQIWDCVLNSAGAPGEVVFWMGPGITAQQLKGRRLVQLAGQCVLRSWYVKLDDAVWCGEANNSNLATDAFYHCDNADGTSRNVNGLYLKLPDASARFFQSIGSHTLPNYYTMVVVPTPGHLTDDKIREHDHVLSWGDGLDRKHVTSFTNKTATFTDLNGYAAIYGDPLSSDTYSSVNVGSVTTSQFHNTNTPDGGLKGSGYIKPYSISTYAMIRY